jgi:ubiquinone/menaquinone biosynthesis C-methylase UbiE
MENWDKFWKENENNPIDNIDNPKNWSDISWQISLEYWLDSFKTIKSRGKILECGCGTATFLQYMANKSYDCYGVDLSEEVLRKTRISAEKRELNIDLKHGDIYKLPYQNNFFDFVYSGGVMEYLQEPEQAIMEMKRVLKPGGVLAMTIVPRKFSIQTIGNIQSTLTNSIYNLCHSNFKEVFRYKQMISSEYSITKREKNDYETMLINQNFQFIVSNTTIHFPNFTLPSYLKSGYISYLHRHKEFFQKLNKNNWLMKDILGITYSIYGIKQ